MKKTFVISLILSLILAACSGQEDHTTILLTTTPEKVITVTSTSTRIPSTQQPLTPTLTPLPKYQNKQVIFDYYVRGDHSVYDIFFDPGSFRSYSKFVLYDDGQLIIPGEPYRQKVLSTDEVKQFLSKLETLGFYSLESNQKHDPTDKIYNYGDNYQKSYDGREYCISINAYKSKSLCVYEPDIQFLIPKMKKILNYLDEYQPMSMTPYSPDRVLLWVNEGRNAYDNNLPETAIPWGEHFPPLGNSITYVDGDVAKDIYLLFASPFAGEVFSQNGKEYTVYIDVVLPHEKVTNANQ
jgi:hypothetical protein